MRDILFKGKRTDNKQWIEGFYVLLGKENPNPYIIKNIKNKARVCHKSICEYTGLTDKNGTKIFEGDILKADGYIFVVKFGKCGGVSNAENYGYRGFYLDGFDEETKACIGYGLRTDICYFTECEVIGNIHDNTRKTHEKRTRALKNDFKEWEYEDNAYNFNRNYHFCGYKLWQDEL